VTPEAFSVSGAVVDGRIVDASCGAVSELGDAVPCSLIFDLTE
jgi:hypothetical protein